MTGASVVVATVAGAEYGIDLDDVVEVVRMVAVRPLPDSPPWLAGVVNRRGELTAVLDARRRLGAAPRPPAVDQVLVFARAHGRVVGLVVDGAGLRRAGPALPVPPAASATAARLVLVDDRPVPVLDPSALCPHDLIERVEGGADVATA